MSTFGMKVGIFSFIQQRTDFEGINFNESWICNHWFNQP